MDYKQFCEEHIDTLNDSKLVDLWNKHCEDDRLAIVEEFCEMNINECMQNWSPWDIIVAIQDTEFDWTKKDAYFTFNSNENFEIWDIDEIRYRIDADFDTDEYGFEQEWCDHCSNVLEELIENTGNIFHVNLEIKCNTLKLPKLDNDKLIDLACDATCDFDDIEDIDDSDLQEYFIDYYVEHYDEYLDDDNA